MDTSRVGYLFVLLTACSIGHSLDESLREYPDRESGTGEKKTGEATSDQPVSRIEGRVVDPSGNPVQGVRATCYVIKVVNGEEWPFGLWRTETKVDGTYAFNVPAGSDYEVRIGREKCTGAASKRFHAKTNVGHRVEDLTVRPAKNSFKGVVLRPDGSPAAGLSFGYGSANFRPVHEVNAPTIGTNGEIQAAHILPDEPVSFWVIPEQNMVQIWRNVDPGRAEHRFLLDPREYVKLPPADWAQVSWVQALAFREPLRFPNNSIGFTLPDLDGKLVSLTDDRFKGKAVVINLWGSWCGGCLKEIPELIGLQSKYAERGLVVLGIAFEDGTIEEQVTRIRKVADRFKFNYANLRGGEIARTDTIKSVILGLEGFHEYPTTIFVGRDGKVADYSVGFPVIDEPTRRFLVAGLEAKIVNILQ